MEMAKVYLATKTKAGDSVQIIKPGVLALIIMTSACASTPGDRGSRDAAKKPLRGGVAEVEILPFGHVLPWTKLGPLESPTLAKKPFNGAVAEFQVASYDGETVKGRVLLGATIDPLVIDSRLILGDLPNARACGSKDRLQKLEICMIFSPPRPDQIINLRPGYWYGAEVSFSFLNNDFTGMGIECIEAELVLRAIDDRVIARLPIRVVRTDKPPATPDGGTEAPPPPPAAAAPAPPASIRP